MYIIYSVYPLLGSFTAFKSYQNLWTFPILKLLKQVKPEYDPISETKTWFQRRPKIKISLSMITE